jgi:hypothetical protein
MPNRFAFFTHQVVAHSVLLSLLVLMINSFWAVVPVEAGEEKPVWYTNLDCNQVTQTHKGVAYCVGKIHYSDGGSSVVQVVVIDLNSPGVQVEYIISEGINDKITMPEECKDVNRSTKYLDPPRGDGCDDPNDRSLYPVFSLDGAVAASHQRFPQLDLAFMINGDYSACTEITAKCRVGIEYRDHGPEGLTVVRGDRLDGPNLGDGDNNIVRRPWLVINSTSPLTAELHQAKSDDGYLPYGWAYTGVGGAPWLIQNGEVSEAAIKSCDGAPGSCYDGASQTAVGLDRDHKWLFFVLGVHPRTLLDLANFMDEKLDAWQAIKFDGGGSSQMYYIGPDNPIIEPGNGRLLTNYLAVFAEPGNGIVLPGQPEEPPSGPPSDDDPSWWESLWQSIWDKLKALWESIFKTIDEKTQDLQRDLEQQVEDWWQGLLDQIAEAILQALQDWLNQLCGTTLLPAGAVAGVWYWKRRRPRKT